MTTACSRGKVVESSGEWVMVEVERSTSCEHCGQKDACLSSVGFDSSRKTLARARNTLGARAGDMVELAISEGVILWGTVILYLIPVFFLLAFILAAFYLNQAWQWEKEENLLAVVAGGLGLLISLGVVRLISTRWKYLAKSGPEVIRILPPEG